VTDCNVIGYLIAYIPCKWEIGSASQKTKWKASGYIFCFEEFLEEKCEEKIMLEFLSISKII
jgi:hypothetical protein